MRYLGIDYGAKRIGVALSDESGVMALPFSVIENRGNQRAIIMEIKKICDENKVTNIVIGESKDYSGKDNPIMMEIAKFEKELLAHFQGAKVALKVHMEPEFMTSAQAERVEFRRPDRDMNRVMARTGAKPNRKVVKNKKLDASAAALILKSFLDRHTNL